MAIVGAVMSHDGIRVLTTTEGGASSGQDVVRPGRGSGPTSRRLIAFAIEIGRLETDRSRLPGAVPRLADLVDQTRLGDRTSSPVSSPSASRARSSSSWCRASRRRRTCRSRSAIPPERRRTTSGSGHRSGGASDRIALMSALASAAPLSPAARVAARLSRAVDPSMRRLARRRTRDSVDCACERSPERPGGQEFGGQHPELPRGARPDDAPSRSARETYSRCLRGSCPRRRPPGCRPPAATT